jgi:hypothetical protein
MGVGYAASPLHRISYLEPIEGAQAQPPPSDTVMAALLETGVVWDGRPTEFRSPSITDIIRWRNRLAEKYQSQPGEELLWDEASASEKSEDPATSADMFPRYTAAVLDQHGSVEVRSLVGMTRPPGSVLNAAFSEAERKGFTGGFPQLLLGAKYWFPFRRHLIIEEPNWRGNVERYGSLFQLSDELDEIRTFIADVNPSATVWTADKIAPRHDILAAAWQASDTVSRLCAIAVAQRLPLWTTG